MQGNEASGEFRIDADFVGGNIVVHRVEADTVYLHQDPRDTPGFWFYWSFRVRGAQGRHLQFQFTRGKAVGVRGPAVSRDQGRSWEWLDDASVTEESFAYTFASDDSDVRFCLAIPYQRADLDAFLEKFADRDDLVVEPHATSRQGRSVVRFRFGCLDREPTHRVLLTARHHACEMMASWVLEGTIESALNNPWLRQHVEFLCVPIVDTDGVANGDQGKNQRPHDPNRDYQGDAIYPEVAALKQLLPTWSGSRLHLVLDMHCPYIRGGNNQQVFFVGGPDEEMAKRLDQFCILLEHAQVRPPTPHLETTAGASHGQEERVAVDSDEAAQSPLPEATEEVSHGQERHAAAECYGPALKYARENNVPWGHSWNTLKEARSCARWAATLPGVQLATTLEIPYADAGGQPVTVTSARALGHDLANALTAWLQGLPPD